MADFPEPGMRSRADSPFKRLAEEIVSEDKAQAETLRNYVARASRRPARAAVEARVDRAPSNGSVGIAERSHVETAPGEKRPARHHANAIHVKEDRRFDTTALHSSLHGKQISHSDYIAHCEKYDYVWRSIKMGDRILDIGCGTDRPLLLAINYVQAQAEKVRYKNGGCYVGVDLNKLRDHQINWGRLYGEVDMTSEEGYLVALEAIPGNDQILNGQPGDLRGYSLITCLEVIEHMDVPDGTRLLENMRDLLSPDGRIVLSTPVFDGKAQARNHIHEYYIDELKELIEAVGLRVARRMGTFTAEPQLKRWLKENRPDWLALYMEAREFHSAGYMSGVLAPMLPDISRNNVWELRGSATV